MLKRAVTYGCYFSLLTSYFFLSGCAQIVAPSGGPEDLQAPMVEKYVPDSAATNFTAKTITIVFDEYIELADIQKEMTISPPMRIQPEVSRKGRVLQLEMKDTLKKNTTYVINFGNSIRDFTRGNPKRDFRYIFSTGNIIDTLRLTGMVKGAYDQKTEQGIFVMLYESLDDSVPYKIGPSYFAKTNADGTYKISNIRPGKYKAFALKDINSNYRFDIPTENIGFSDTLIKISKKTSLDFRLFQEEPKKQRLLKNYTSGYGNMTLVYAKPVSGISYKPLNGTTKTETFLTEFNRGRDSIRIWFPVSTKDSMYFKVIADEISMDTVRIGAGQFKKDGGKGDGFRLTANINVSKDRPMDINADIVFKFSHPIRTANAKDIFLTAGNRKISYSNSNISDSIKRVFSFKFPLEPDSSYQLFVLPGTFTDIFDLKNDTIKVNFKVQEEKFYGTLKLTMKMKYRIPFVLELVSEKGVVFNYLSSDRGIFPYRDLPPGAYKLRVVYDQNGDGKWTTGNYLEKRKPETIMYYPAAVTIRSNWDLELDWKVE